MKSIVVAYDKNYGIGASNDILWKRDLPADLRRFRDITLGSAVIMGRKTYESIGNILHGRLNIIVTHKFMEIPGLILARGLKEAYEAAGDRDTMIIGGASIYEQALPDVDRIYATEVHAEFKNADVFFPRIDPREWREVSREKRYADGANKYDFDFVIYERKQAAGQSNRQIEPSGS